MPIALVYTSFLSGSIFLALNTKMSKYIVVHTPGAFGNFLAWLVDCYQQKKVNESPFAAAGNSHNREIITEAWDIIMPWNKQKFEKNEFGDSRVLAIYWPQSYFPYILHASIDRTNVDQYGESGVKYAEKNFYDFVNKHQSVLDDGSIWMASYFSRLKEYFNFECGPSNTTVPRVVLRNLFWLNLAAEKEHIWTVTNKLIEKSAHEKISMETILEYNNLKERFDTMFGCSLDFKEIHDQFLKRNNSLKEFNTAMGIVNSVKNGKRMEIPELTVIGECIVMWYLEKHFFDINFFNLPFYFKNTDDILEYVNHYPHYMRQPNKFFQNNWRDFKKND